MTLAVDPERRLCQCGHERASHYAEVESSGDVNQQRRTVYAACLANYCDCGLYRQEKQQ